MATNIRNLFEDARLLTLASGTFINGAFGGTQNGLPMGEFEYASVVFAGTMANNGTINVIACTSPGGSSTPTVIRTLQIGSSNGHGAVVDVKASALNNISPGTQFTHIGAQGTIESGGTWRGALFIIGHSARSAPPGTTGLAAYGTYLA